MILIIGLGNPGKKYINSRHNIGFQVIEEFQKRNNFPKFEMKNIFNSLISKKGDIILAKPQTFMNSSGIAVKKILKRFGGELIVVHDDIDISFGSTKVSRNRGAAGHKGVESIINELGTKDFTRLRIGIQPEKGKPKNTNVFVLKNFNKKEKQVLGQIISQSCQTLKTITTNQ